MSRLVSMSKPYEKIQPPPEYHFDCDLESWVMIVCTDMLLVRHEQHGNDVSVELHAHVEDGARVWTCDKDEASDLASNTRDTTPAAIEAYIAKHELASAQGWEDDNSVDDEFAKRCDRTECPECGTSRPS